MEVIVLIGYAYEGAACPHEVIQDVAVAENEYRAQVAEEHLIAAGCDYVERFTRRVD